MIIAAENPGLSIHIGLFIKNVLKSECFRIKDESNLILFDVCVSNNK